MSNTIGRRGSMTISPVLEMMRSSASNLDLPLFNPTPDYPSNIPVVSSEPSQSQPVRKSRPPSMVLDDMLTAIEFTNDYPDVFDDHSH
ncbi:hypothetical protein JCM33374_g6647 [Metschnikowia sp. JCM 33374]|nr:hypothetical protein JCM33374_g6647 [Metschnikowia sp. JCM 33374]